MKILIDSTAKLFDQHYQRLKNIGEYQNYTLEDFSEKANDADIIIVNKKFDNNQIPKLKVRMISVWSTGYDVIDVEKCKEDGITVTNVPGYSTFSVAEHVFGLIIELTKRINSQNNFVKQGKWTTQIPKIPLLTELSGKTIGIIGYGNIGRQVAKIAKGFDMNILVYNRTKKDDANYVELDELLKKSDFVTLHLVLTEETKNFISKKQLDLMKKTAILINCARGAIINEKNLVEALRNKTISGAALDVYWKEPIPKDHPLLKLDNVILTPHSAFLTKEALIRLGDECIDNVENFLSGNKSNVL